MASQALASAMKCPGQIQIRISMIQSMTAKFRNRIYLRPKPNTNEDKSFGLKAFNWCTAPISDTTIERNLSGLKVSWSGKNSLSCVIALERHWN